MFDRLRKQISWTFVVIAVLLAVLFIVAAIK